MVRSVGFALYMVFSNCAVSYADRLLERRLGAGKEDPVRIGERRGRASADRPRGKLLWFHAASVGEALSIQSLVRRLGDEDPALSFLLTTGTRTSAEVMASRLPPCAIHQYIPLDALAFVRAFLNHWRPDVAIWTESEFWPALMAETDRRGIPMLLINARMSPRSYRRWRCLPGFAASLLRRFRFALVQ
ncbi:MAG: glycosyltransferase N-terminal domain-containing protein, partial [Pseudomonadota bacterium]